MVRLDKIGITSEAERERRMDLATVLLMTVRGIPIVYYGDEQYLADYHLFEANGYSYSKESINSTADDPFNRAGNEVVGREHFGVSDHQDLSRVAAHKPSDLGRCLRHPVR
jgi:glycosidase